VVVKASQKMLKLLLGLAAPLAVNSFLMPTGVRTAVKTNLLQERHEQQRSIPHRAVAMMAGAASGIEQLLVKPIDSFDGVIDLPGKLISV
jgi:hypothetical protein